LAKPPLEKSVAADAAAATTASSSAKAAGAAASQASAAAATDEGRAVEAKGWIDESSPIACAGPWWAWRRGEMRGFDADDDDDVVVVEEEEEAKTPTHRGDLAGLAGALPAN
jgi:hypothetical protein